MSANARNSLTIVLGVAVAMAIVAFLLLQSLGKTTVSDDYDLPPVVSWNFSKRSQVIAVSNVLAVRLRAARLWSVAVIRAAFARVFHPWFDVVVRGFERQHHDGDRTISRAGVVSLGAESRMRQFDG